MSKKIWHVWYGESLQHCVVKADHFRSFGDCSTMEFYDDQDGNETVAVFTKVSHCTLDGVMDITTPFLQGVVE